MRSIRRIGRGVGALSFASALLCWNRPVMAADPPISHHQLQVGTGVLGFFANNAPSPGATWDVRYAYTPHPVVSLEGAYIGAANDSYGPGTTLVTGVEGCLRLNAVVHPRINPYLLAGAGWEYFHASGATSGALALPVGLGAEYRIGDHMVAGGRFTYRLTPHDHTGINDASADNWQIVGSFGAKF
jgi:hypothetical protein